MKKITGKSKWTGEKAHRTSVIKGAIFTRVRNRLTESRLLMERFTKNWELFKKKMTKTSAWLNSLVRIASTPLILVKKSYFYRKTLSSVRPPDKVTLVKNLPQMLGRVVSLERVITRPKATIKSLNSLMDSPRKKALAIPSIQTRVIKRKSQCKAETYSWEAYSCQISY